jgi:hypothetical protein
MKYAKSLVEEVVASHRESPGQLPPEVGDLSAEQVEE